MPVQAVDAAATNKGVTSGVVQTTRPNDTNAYAAGDVVGGLITFPNMAPSSGGQVLITTSHFFRGSSALASGEASYTLHLYSAAPASPLADNAVWDVPSGDRAIYQGPIEIGTPVDLGSTIEVLVPYHGIQVTSSDGNLYGYLKTNAIYTPQALSITHIELHGTMI